MEKAVVGYVLLQRARMAGWLVTLTWVHVQIPTLKGVDLGYLKMSEINVHIY
jgi:hypothetical protein